jgi:hypothetical protein
MVAGFSRQAEENQMAEQFVDRVHSEAAVLDIGEDLGALIVYAGAELRGMQIDASPLGADRPRIHTDVLERRVQGRPVFAALFLALPAGHYTLWRGDVPTGEARVDGGAVAEVDWRGLPDAQAPYAGAAYPHAQRRPPITPDMLPPRYRNGAPVCRTPMGSAPMRYTPDGRVAWHEMWIDFCDLALAGGPPHRATMLEPADPRAASAAPDAYARVVAEIERGFRLVTALQPVPSAVPGWVGLRCQDEDMASWLCYAIEAENVAVRRDGTVIFLPAGPDFALEKEIKNVVTVVAKTCHYCTEHRTAQDSLV